MSDSDHFQPLVDRIKELEAEIVTALATNERLHRRCQEAESRAAYCAARLKGLGNRLLNEIDFGNRWANRIKSMVRDERRIENGFFTRQEKERLQTELAEARQEIERLKAEVAALAPADY